MSGFLGFNLAFPPALHLRQHYARVASVLGISITTGPSLISIFSDLFCLLLFSLSICDLLLPGFLRSLLTSLTGSWCPCSFLGLCKTTFFWFQHTCWGFLHFLFDILCKPFLWHFPWFCLWPDIPFLIYVLLRKCTKSSIPHMLSCSLFTAVRPGNSHMLFVFIICLLASWCYTVWLDHQSFSQYPVEELVVVSNISLLQIPAGNNLVCLFPIYGGEGLFSFMLIQIFIFKLFLKLET